MAFNAGHLSVLANLEDEQTDYRLQKPWHVRKRAGVDFFGWNFNLTAPSTGSQT